MKHKIIDYRIISYKIIPMILSFMILSSACRANPAFFEKHCYQCHDAATKKGGFDLSAAQDRSREPGEFRPLAKGA